MVEGAIVGLWGSREGERERERDGVGGFARFGAFLLGFLDRVGDGELLWWSCWMKVRCELEILKRYIEGMTRFGCTFDALSHAHKTVDDTRRPRHHSRRREMRDYLQVDFVDWIVHSTDRPSLL